MLIAITLPKFNLYKSKCSLLGLAPDLSFSFLWAYPQKHFWEEKVRLALIKPVGIKKTFIDERKAEVYRSLLFSVSCRKILYLETV